MPLYKSNFSKDILSINYLLSNRQRMQHLKRVSKKGQPHIAKHNLTFSSPMKTMRAPATVSGYITQELKFMKSRENWITLYQKGKLLGICNENRVGT